MQMWAEFTAAGSREKVRLHYSTIIGVRPCDNASAGAVIDVLFGSIGNMILVEESPDAAWAKIEACVKPGAT